MFYLLLKIQGIFRLFYQRPLRQSTYFSLRGETSDEWQGIPHQKFSCRFSLPAPPASHLVTATLLFPVTSVRVEEHLKLLKPQTPGSYAQCWPLKDSLWSLLEGLVFFICYGCWARRKGLLLFLLWNSVACWVCCIINHTSFATSNTGLECMCLK